MFPSRGFGAVQTRGYANFLLMPQVRRRAARRSSASMDTFFTPIASQVSSWSLSLWSAGTSRSRHWCALAPFSGSSPDISVGRKSSPSCLAFLPLLICSTIAKLFCTQTTKVCCTVAAMLPPRGMCCQVLCIPLLAAPLKPLITISSYMKSGLSS